MKNYFLLSIFAIILTSCSNSTEPKYSIDSNKLTKAFINYNSETVRTELENLVADLKPNITKNDELGHKKNFETFVKRINSNSNNLISSLVCYACIYTNPPQSEMEFSLDSSGTKIKRMLNVVTSSDKILILGNIH